MSKSEVTVGKVYAAKISGKVTQVRIDGESRHGGWDATNLQSSKKVRIKSAGKLRYEVVKDGDGKAKADAKTNPKTAPNAEATKADKPAKETKATKPAKAKKLSAIDAAARVLAETGEVLGCKELIESMASKGLWSSPKGKTPHATLYSAILREINAKGKDARFVKAERGKFTKAGS